MYHTRMYKYVKNTKYALYVIIIIEYRYQYSTQYNIFYISTKNNIYNYYIKIIICECILYFINKNVLQVSFFLWEINNPLLEVRLVYGTFAVGPKLFISVSMNIFKIMCRIIYLLYTLYSLSYYIHSKNSKIFLNVDQSQKSDNFFKEYSEKFF